MNLVILECGHAINLNKPEFKSNDGRTLYKFQELGIDFLNSPSETGRGKLVADEQGLGKTVQFLCWISDKPERLPALIVTKSKVTRQWLGEIHRWNNTYGFLISGKGIIPGFKYYVVSVDLLRNLSTKEIQQIGIKTICLDECQSIKNTDAKRTQEVMNLAKPTGECKCGHHAKEHEFKLVEAHDSTKYRKPVACGIENCQCQEYKDKSDLFIVGLSGTPILNRVSEYYPILHLIDSVRFPSESIFEYNWVDSYWDGFKMKKGGIRNVSAWKELTKDIIIRRERTEVMPDLPEIDRQVRWVDLTKSAQEEYDKQEKGFIDEYIQAQLEGTIDKSMMHLLAYIARMRHIIGLSKVPDCIDYVTDFLISTGRKICVFVHHKDVGEILTRELNKWLKDGAFQPVLQIRGSMHPDELAEVQKKFNTDESYKVLVASTLAAGEGLNLQEQCGDVVMLERQWNPPKEEQAISRFVRIGFMKSSKIKLNSVIAQYILAIGTIDDWLTSLIEEKRSIFDQAVNNREVEAAEMQLMQMLMQKIVNEGRKRWKLST
jgi:SNF2 family DNA or RNA helicase